MIANRTMPVVDPSEAHFWCGGKEGRLLISRCQSCSEYIHPTGPICPACLSREIKPEAVSGKAVISTFTINYQAWFPDLEVPYVVAIVELEEQPSVRLMTNIVGCDLESVHIGMKVRVIFKQVDEIFLPLFEPEVTA
ncbi:MAG: OB-fold domain-containing protein [Halioglobus sp.]|nr:OB-fold domain-containing protein [Halioglobus sp.]